MLTNNDLLVIIDMNNGFVKEGALSSPNVLELVPKMQQFVKEAIDNNIEIIHYVDSHDENCHEFNFYPAHCIKGSIESEVIDELNFPQIRIIHKNSTNGFLVENPLLTNKNLYVIGCVSDICVRDFTHSAIKYIHEYNLNQTVTVIENLCATFDAPNHDSKKVHDDTMQALKNEGVKIVSI